MDQKNLPNSAKIIEIFEAQLKSIKKLDDTIIKGKIDPASVKRVQDFVAPVAKLLKDLSDIAKLADFINNNSSFLFNLKFKIKFKIMMSNIESIAKCIEEFGKKTKANKKDFENLNNATKAIKETLNILKDLIKDVSLVGIMLLNPLIYLSLPLIILFLAEIRFIALAISHATSIKFTVFGKSKRKAIKDSLDTIYEVAKHVSIVAVMLINPLVWLGFSLIKVFITKVKWLLVYLGRIHVSIKTLVKIKLLSTIAKDMIAMIGWFALASIAVVLLLPIFVVTMPLFLLTLYLVCKGLSLVGKVSLKALIAITVISLVAVAIGGLAVSLALAALLVSLIDYKALLLFVVMLIPLVVSLALFGLLMSVSGVLIIAACAMLTIIGLSLLIAAGTFALVSVILNKSNLTGIGELVITNLINPMIDIANAIDTADLGIFITAAIKLMFMVSMSFSILLVAKILRGISNLKFVAEIDEATGKPKRYEQFAEKDFSGATNNCLTIVNSLAQVATEINDKVNFKAAFKASAKIIQLVVIAAAISRIAKILSKMAKLEMPDEIDPRTGNVIKWSLMDKKDFETAAQNMGIIITTLLKAITNEDISKKLDDLSAKSILKIRMVLNSAAQVKNIVDAIQMVSSMIVPEEIDPRTGKIIKYKLLTDDDIQLATENIAKIMTTFLMALTNPELETQINSMNKRAIEKINQVMGTAAYVKDLFDAIEKSATFNPDTLGTSMDNIQKAVVSYINLLNTLFIEKSHIEWYYKNWHDFGFKRIVDSEAIISENEINAIMNALNGFNEIFKPMNDAINDILKSASSADEKTIKKVNNLANIITGYTDGILGNPAAKKQGIRISQDAYKKISLLSQIISNQKRIEQLSVDKLEKNTNNFIKFVDKANSIDTDKIKSVTEMFAQMSDFSKSIKGDFDKLADVLSEKLVDILDKLHGTLKEINKSDNSSPATATNNNSGMLKPADNKNEKKEKVDLTGIENELNEILSELQNITNRRW